MTVSRVISNNLITIVMYLLISSLINILSVSPIGAPDLWIGVGIVIAVVILWGYALLPAVFIGQFLLGFDLLAIHQQPLLLTQAVLDATCVSLMALLSRYLLVRFHLWPNPLIREKSISQFFLLILLVGIGIPLINYFFIYWLIYHHAFSESLQTLIMRWVGISIGTVVAISVLFSFFSQPRAFWQHRIFRVSAPQIFLFLIYLVLLVVARERDDAFNQTRLEATASLLSASIDNELTQQNYILRSLQSYITYSEDVKADEFKSIVKSLYKNSQSKGEVIFLIAAKESNELSSNLNSKYPQLVVKYSQRLDNDNTVLPGVYAGADFCTSDRLALCKQFWAKEDSLFRLSFVFPSHVSSQNDFAEFLSIKNQQGNIMGFLLQTRDFEWVFSKIYTSLNTSWIDFKVTNLRDGEVIFNSSSMTKKTSRNFQTGFEASRIIQNSGQQWRIDFIPSDSFINGYSSWSYFWLSGLALVVSLFSVVWLLTMSGRFKLIEEEVTDKTRALAEKTEILAVNEEKYRRLVETIEDEYFLYSHDVKGIFHYVSPSITSILGYTQEEFLNHYTTFMPDSEINRRGDKLTAETLAGDKKVYEIEVISKSGHLHRMIVTEMPSYNDKDEVIGVEGIARDITHSIASIEKLEKLSLAVKHSPNAVLIMDKTGRIEYINPKFTTITGYSNKDELGVWPDLINSRTNLPGVYKEIWRTIEAGREWHGELQNRKKNGDLYWAQELIAPMVDANGVLTHFILTQVDVTEARRLNDETSHQAKHDQLTGLVNRREFNVRLERVIQAAQHSQTEHALCFIDLDQFKVVNDTCGHAAGDELLRQIASLLQTNTRSRDTLARFGGDEFIILMEYCSVDQAFKACEQIVSLLSDFRFHHLHYSFSVGGSIGLTIVDQFTSDASEAIKNADIACYQAKDAGRNRVEIHNEDYKRLRERRGDTQWQIELNEALENNRFVLYVQAIKPLQEPSTKLSYEVLLRLQRETGELSLPGAFLPAAERYNIITKIDRWVIKHCCDWIENNSAKMANIASLSINISGTTLSDESIVHLIIERLKRNTIPAEKIVFEITETAAIANLRAASHFMSELSQYGVKFALDDFGSGLSSFAYLKTLKVDRLKIDGMFVKDMTEDAVDFEMVKSINQMGHVMGLKTIAEFAEKTAIIEALTEVGVDYAQGYAIGKPIHIDEAFD